MDEVLADHTGSFNVYHDNKYGTDLRNMVIDEFYLHNLIDVTAEEEMQRIKDYYHTDDFLNMKPIEGAVEAVRELAKGNELYVITSRPDFVAQASQEWLNEYFPGCFKEFVILNHHFGGVKVKKKSDICREKKIEVMIDDLADYANDCAQVCKKVILFNKPWNIGKKIEPNVTRAENWVEILKSITNYQ